MSQTVQTTERPDPESAVSASPSASPKPRARPSWLVVALVLGYLLHVAWRIWLSRNLNAPAAHADEDGYLVAARALAGGPGGVTTENEAFRRLGYPLLLAPIYLFTSDAFTVYKSALVLNAFYNALVFPLAVVFGTRVLGLSWRMALPAGFAVALMPAVVFYTEFALTDAVLAPIAMAWLLLAHHWITATGRGRWVGALGAGLAAGFFYVVHVRGLMIVAVHGLLLITLLLLRRTGWRLAAGSVAAVGVAACLDPAAKLLIRGDIVAAGRSPKEQTVDAITTLDGLGRMVGGANGQIWYLCMATLGLGAVGLIAAALHLRSPRRALSSDDAPRVLIVLTLLVTTLLIALSSSAALPPADNRLNYYAYPRYIHLLFPMWTLVGLSALLVARTLRRTLALAAAGAALTLVTALVVYVRIQSVEKAAFTPFDIPEAAFLGWTWTAFSVLQPTATALVLFALIAFVPRLAGRGRGATGPAVEPAARPLVWTAVVACLALLYATNMALVTSRISEPMVAFQYTPTTPRIVQDGYVRPGDRVAFAMRYQPTWYLRFNHMREVYWTRIVYFDQTAVEPPADADAIVAPWRPTEPQYHWDGGRRGYRTVVIDEKQRWAVWRRD